MIILDDDIRLGLQPLMVTSDAWYSSGDNLKLLKDKELGFLIGIAKPKSRNQ